MLKGVNWFGFETETFSPHGLWSTSMDYLLDFLKKEKFNAVRLPFSTEFAEKMDTAYPTGIDFSQNPDLQGKKAGQVMDILIRKCRDRGIYVMPDMHRFEGRGQISELWYNERFSERRVIEAWKRIVSRYKNDQTVFAVDLKNEPHGRATWGTGDPKTDWALAAERMGNALLTVNPKLLVFVEGIERTKDHPTRTSWWGGSLDQVSRRPIKLKIPNRLVYSPHVYGPDVFYMSYFRDKNFPKNLPAIWTSDWAFIKDKKLGPLVIGEWGGRNEPGSKDREWQTALVSFYEKKGLTCKSFYWCLNPNSGDTKGLLQDDWRTPVRYRLRMAERACPKPTHFGIPSILKQAQHVQRYQMQPLQYQDLPGPTDTNPSPTILDVIPSMLQAPFNLFFGKRK